MFGHRSNSIVKIKSINKYIVALFMMFFSLISFGFSAWIISSSNTGSASVDSNAFMAVCYYSGNGNPKFRTIEEGVKYANDQEDGGTVYVYPNLRNLDGSLKEIVISDDIEIKKGVTLCLPYEGTKYDIGENFDLDKAEFSDYDQSTVNNYRRTLVGVAPNVTITVNGTLTIGGYCGNIGQPVCGGVNGDYTELLLYYDAASGASIDVNDGGIINCYGYIKEADWYIDENGDEAYRENTKSSIDVANGGQIYTVFTLYDFKGGTITLNLKNKGIFPFYDFDVSLIQTKICLEYGSLLAAYVRVSVSLSFLGSIETNELASAVGTSDAFMVMGEGSYLEFEYMNSPTDYNGNASYKFTRKPYSDGGTFLNQGNYTQINLSGNISLGFIEASILSYSISTADSHLPVGYRFKFNVLSGAKLTIPYAAKLLPGAELNIQSGATFEVANSLIAYKQNQLQFTGDYTLWKYPINLASAKIVNNGTINVTSTGSLGGYIETENANASLNLANASSVRASCTEDYSKTITVDTTGDVLDTTVSSDGSLAQTKKTSNLAKSNYTSSNMYNNYVWGIGDTAKFPIKYFAVMPNGEIIDDFNPGDTLPTYFIYGETLSLGSPTIILNGNPNFGGWFFDSSLTNQMNAISGEQLYNSYFNKTTQSLNVYAKYVFGKTIDVNFYKISGCDSEYNPSTYVHDDKASLKISDENNDGYIVVDLPNIMTTTYLGGTSSFDYYVKYTLTGWNVNGDLYNDIGTSTSNIDISEINSINIYPIVTKDVYFKFTQTLTATTYLRVGFFSWDPINISSLVTISCSDQILGVDNQTKFIKKGSSVNIILGARQIGYRNAKAAIARIFINESEVCNNENSSFNHAHTCNTAMHLEGKFDG